MRTFIVVVCLERVMVLLFRGIGNGDVVVGVVSLDAKARSFVGMHECLFSMVCAFLFLWMS